MKTQPTTHKPGDGLEARPLGIFRQRAGEYLLFALLLTLANTHLAGTTVQPSYIPAAVAAGEWWRILLHPFAHVSGYHLWLDGAAFFTLYHALRERRIAVRLAFLIAAGAGSLALSLYLAPQVKHLGLCGLSGIGHGLMTIVALEMIRDRDKFGWPCLATVLAKTTWEAATGHVVLQAWHLGSVGSPIVVSHLGGVLGAAAFWSLSLIYHLFIRRLAADRMCRVRCPHRNRRRGRQGSN